MPKATPVKHKVEPTKPARNPKDSHLYTDDNPKTTLHGTGFKDAAAAHATISLVARRSLTYQFQTINTMLYRAKHHPHKTMAMQEAIVLFQEWVDGYKQRKAALRDFPLLPRPIVEKYLSSTNSWNAAHGETQQTEEENDETIDTSFAEMYIALPAKKRLGNTLLDDAQPGEQDWEIRRYQALDALVPDDKAVTSNADALWEKVGQPTHWHLRLIMWGYSPVKKLK